MIVETFSAFAEGLALIVSPCILPVLPLVLAASSDGGRRRPFGVIIGFVLSFSIFALLSRHLVTVLGIDLNIIKNISLIFLSLFGIILLSETLSEQFSEFTQGMADFGNKLAVTGKGGFRSGILIGTCIGLIWTPCAGPILAAVLVEAIREQTDIGSYMIVVAFALGAGIPMLIIALAGRTIMGHLEFFTKHADHIRKVFGGLIILSVIVIASGFDAATFFETNKSELNVAVEDTAEEGNGIKEGVSHPYPAPDIVGISEWLNSKPLAIGDLKGKVILIDFWTYSCINCVRTLPQMIQLDKEYRDKGLVIIGIHAPEFEFEKNPENVKAALVKHKIEYPVALDNHLSTWSNFNNKAWPAHYLIDKNGKVVYVHEGEGKNSVTENNIRHLLGLDKKPMQEEKPQSNPKQTPETYLGYVRTANFANQDEGGANKAADYVLPKTLADNSWALGGKWNVSAESIESANPDAALELNFKAKKVFLVMGNDGAPVDAEVRLNGELYKTITVDHHDLYELVAQEKMQKGTLEIKSSAPGLKAYSFTFGE